MSFPFPKRIVAAPNLTNLEHLLHVTPISLTHCGCPKPHPSRAFPRHQSNFPNIHWLATETLPPERWVQPRGTQPSCHAGVFARPTSRRDAGAQSSVRDKIRRSRPQLEWRSLSYSGPQTIYWNTIKVWLDRHLSQINGVLRSSLHALLPHHNFVR